MPQAIKKPTILIKKNLFLLLNASQKSKLFQHVLVEKSGKEFDILKNGKLSCAFFVSFILHHLKLIQEPHATVSGTVRDLEASGWQQVKDAQPGCVIVWEATRDHEKDMLHEHIGFYLGKSRAISNSSSKRYPIKHHWTFGLKQGKPKRRIEAIYAHPSLYERPHRRKLETRTTK